MALAVSSAVAPGFDLAALARACRLRGLDGAELALDATTDLPALAPAVRASGLRVLALRAESPAPGAGALAALAAALAVPLSVPAAAIAPGALPAWADVFAGLGARLLLAEGSDGRALAALAGHLAAADAHGTLGIAWDLRPSTDELADPAALLAAAGARLGLVRLHGGGPEQRAQDGRGVGPLMSELARARFAGPIVLCASAPAQLPAWQAWLVSTGSAGCGTRTDPRRIDVDVRDVEPRDRLETILGAYGALAPGATLHVTVDHDPSCMYYMLEATEPAGSFDFRTVLHGPEVWRAEVTRR